MTKVHFCEIVWRDDFDLEIDEPLPQVFLIAIPPDPMKFFQSSPSPQHLTTLVCRRYRLEFFNGVPRYVHNGYELY